MDLVTSCKMILAKVFVYNPVVLKKKYTRFYYIKDTSYVIHNDVRIILNKNITVFNSLLIKFQGGSTRCHASAPCKAFGFFNKITHLLYSFNSITPVCLLSLDAFFNLCILCLFFVDTF